MHCPYLAHNNDGCEAADPHFSPSEFALDEICATDRHRRCPLYRSRSAGPAQFMDIIRLEVAQAID